MSLKFTLRPEYEGLSGGTCVVGTGETINVFKALQEGNGAIIVDDPEVISALRGYSGAKGPVLQVEGEELEEEPTFVRANYPVVETPTPPQVEHARLEQQAAAEHEGEGGYDGMTVEELRSELENRELPTSGKKADLIAALQVDDAKKEEAGE